MKAETRNSKTESAQWDAIVVGAGPAGSVAAYLLAKRGWRVLLVEKSQWPREKACGGCLNAAGTRLLHEAGLAETLHDALPLSRMQLHSGSHIAAFDLPRGSVIERRTFDARLVAAAQNAGCRFRPETHARLLPAQDSSCRSLLLEQDGEAMPVQARLVLACDGLAKPGRGFLTEEPWAAVRVAAHPRLGFSLTLPASQFPTVRAGRLTMCLANAGYAGIVQTGHDSIHLGAALSPAACHAARGPHAVITSILDHCGIAPPTDWQQTEVAGTGPLTAQRDTVGHGRILSLGDAAGYVEPFTGEGISWAIRAAIAAANLLPLDPVRIPDNIGTQWNDHFNEHLRPRQRWCRTLRPLLANTLLTRLGVETIRLFPRSAELIAQRISA